MPILNGANALSEKELTVCSVNGQISTVDSFWISLTEGDSVLVARTDLGS